MANFWCRDTLPAIWTPSIVPLSFESYGLCDFGGPACILCKTSSSLSSLSTISRISSRLIPWVSLDYLNFSRLDKVNGFFFLTIDDTEAFLCNNGGRLVSLGAPVGFCSTVYERTTWRAPWLCCSALCLLTVDSRSRWYFVDCWSSLICWCSFLFFLSNATYSFRLTVFLPVPDPFNLAS